MNMLTCYKLPHYFPSNPWHFKVLFILWWKTEVIAWNSFVIFWPVLILIKFLSLKVITTCTLEIWALLCPQSLLLESHSAERNWNEICKYITMLNALQNGWCRRAKIRKEKMDSLLRKCDVDYVPCCAQWIWSGSRWICQWGKHLLCHFMVLCIRLSSLG